MWNGNFVGLELSNEKGVVATSLKSAFLEQFALSSGIIVYLNRKILAKPSLYGSKDALLEVMSCHKQYVAAAASSGERPSEGKKPKGGAGSSGTGFFVSSAGHILTNNHVVEDCRKIEVTLGGQSPRAAELVARDKANDLALLRSYFTAPVAPALRPQARLGEPVFVFGFPLSDLLSSSGNFTLGSVTAVTGLGDDTRFLQVSAPVQPGNSGGPLLDKYGNVTGVIVAKLNALSVAAATKDIPQNVNFAIKSAIAANFLTSNGVATSESVKSRELPPEAIAELAKTFTVKVSCN
jgi:S1-C subfamily serine protease